MRNGVTWGKVNAICAFSFLVMLVVLFMLAIGFELLGPVLLVLYIMAVVSGIVVLLKDKEKTNHSFLNLQLVLLTLVALGIFLAPPGPLIQTEQEAAESVAISTLRAIASAQEVYADKWKSYGTAAKLGDENLLDDRIMNATEAEAATESGYLFVIKLSEDGKSWCAIAYPAQSHESAWKSFHITSDGAIRFRDHEVKNQDWDERNYPNKLGE